MLTYPALHLVPRLRDGPVVLYVRLRAVIQTKCVLHVALHALRQLPKEEGHTRRSEWLHKYTK